MMRGIRPGCSAGGCLFTMAFGSVHRWFMSTVLPPEPHRPWFLQRCACACAGDFALATSSLREALPDMARAFEVDDAVTGQCLHHKNAIGASTGMCPFHTFLTGSAPTFPPSVICRSATIPGIWASKLGPALRTADGPKPRTNSLVSVPAFAALEKSGPKTGFVQDLCPVRSHLYRICCRSRQGYQCG